MARLPESSGSVFGDGSVPNVIGYLLDIDGLQAKTTDLFRTQLLQQSLSAGFEASYIAAVIRLESDFQAAAMNPNGKALGLIQFWQDYFAPVAARAGRPGTPWSDLALMSAVEQLPFVIAYYQNTGLGLLGRSATPTDYRMATFMPAFLGKPPSTVLGQRDSQALLPGTQLKLGTVYAQNAALDSNHDGAITIADVGASIESLVAAARLRPLVPVNGPARTGTEPAPGAPVATAARPSPAAALAGVGLVFFCPSCSGRCVAYFERAEA